MIREFGTKMAADCISIIYNQNQQLTDWVCQGLNVDTSWLNRYMTLGVQYHGKTIAALIYHDIKPTQELSWTIYSIDKHWCKPIAICVTFGFV